MLDQLPIDLLHTIFALLHDQQLITVASLCRSLHIAALDELFARHQTLIPTPTSLPRRVPGLDYTFTHPTPGICVNLTGANHLAALSGLRLALPYLFHDRPITAVTCTFNRPLELLEKEMRNLGRFLFKNPSATSIEAIVLDFEFALLTRWPQYPIREPAGLLEFLRLFNESRLKLPRCTSLTLLGGQTSHAFDSGIPNPSWLRGGYRGSNYIQTLAALTSRHFNPHSTCKSKSMIPGLSALNVDSSFIFHAPYTSWTLDFFAQHSASLRSLSIARWNYTWQAIIARLMLPNLEELYLNDCPISVPVLLNFVIRHRKIKLLDMGTPATLFDDTCALPPFLLPNLTTLITWGLLLGYILKPNIASKPLPNLESVALWVCVNDDKPFIQFLWGYGVKINKCVARRLSNVALGLRVFVKSRCTGWITEVDFSLNSRLAYPEQVAVCDKINFLQITLESGMDFLEKDEVLEHFARWLQLFPVVESVEMWCCSPTSEKNFGSRQELVRSCKMSNTRLRTFSVDGVDLME